MRCKILCAGLLASVAAGAGAALAADIAGGAGVTGGRPGVGVVPIGTSPIETWTGFYAGIHGGFGSGHTSIDPAEFESFETPFTFPGQSSSGGVFGFQFGHNWQWGPVVGGLEIDFSGANIKGSTTFNEFEFNDRQTFNQEQKIDALASARGRLGYLIFPNWLFYGTAGIGWAHSRFNLNQVDIDLKSQPFETNTLFANEFGWVAGVGVEWKLAEHWLLRGEWLHYDFGTVTHPNLVAPPFDGPNEDNFNFRTRVDVGRAAISYRFGP
jgi:outer membrane immunogenic protein